MRLIDADEFERVVMFSDDEDIQDVIYRLRDFPSVQPEIPIKTECLTCEHCEKCEVNGYTAPKPCEDTVSRQAAIEALAKLARDKFSLEDWYQVYINALIDASDIIEALPSAQPEQKIGHWINEGIYGEGHSMCSIRCSECDWHYIGYIGDYNFCPYCGARMEE